MKAAGPIWELEETTSFLLVAATLLDLKAARLLPQGDVEDEEDLALLEARNFWAVTRYNWSSYYAMAVIELGQAVALRVNGSGAR